MRPEMSLRVVQTSREAVLDAVDVPWTRSHRTKVKADLPMCVLVSVQVPLLRFSIAALSASIRPSMSLDVAIEQTPGFLGLWAQGAS